MIEFKTKALTWFLEDDSFIPIVRDVSHPEGARRGYTVGEHNGDKIFIKTFTEKGISGRVRSLIAPRGKKEFVIAGKLCKRGVAAPLPIGYGLGPHTSAILEYYIDGRTFLEALESSEDRNILLGRLAVFLKSLKDACVRHDDLHLNNILVSGDAFYLIDLHKVKAMSSFSLQDEITNLTHSLGMIYYDLSPGEKDMFFARYKPSSSLKDDLTRSINSLRAKWVLNKMARAFRDTSIVHRKGTRLYVRGREECATGKFVETVKKDRKIKVERYGDHIRKTYTGKHRIRTAWRNHVVLEYMHKAITPAVYYAEIPAVGHGYIAMEDLTGRGEELDRHLDGHYDTMDGPERIAFIAALAQFFLRSMEWAITHRDLKACNIFVLARGGFLFLDVEDINFEKVSPDILKRLFIQLNNTVPKRISPVSRMRFYLRLVSLVDCDKKRLFKEVIAESREDNIVYEGVSGLVVDSWK